MPYDGAFLAFGDVILVPFPFTDQMSSKRRPAVVVSVADYAEARPDVIIMAITSKNNSSTAYGEHYIEDWEGAGLLKPSTIKPVVATIEQSLILQRMGRLGSNDVAALRGVLLKILDSTNVVDG
jgi:mRNA interferase MazF